MASETGSFFHPPSLLRTPDRSSTRRMCVPKSVSTRCSFPSSVEASNTTRSNCGTILPGPKLPREPRARVPLGHSERAFAASPKSLPPEFNLARSACARAWASAPLRRMCDAVAVDHMLTASPSPASCASNSAINFF